MWVAPSVGVFIPPQSGVEQAKRGGFPPRLKMGGVEHSTPVLHPSLGWSKGGKRGGAGWSTFFRISVCSTPVWGGAWGGRDVTLLRRRRTKNDYIWEIFRICGVDFFAPQPKNKGYIWEIFRMGWVDFLRRKRKKGYIGEGEFMLSRP